jgi:peptidoglycan/LPS O-acetylase OafA/YrhL
LYIPAPPGISIHAGEPYPFNGPAWSLFFELLANVVFALIAVKLTTRALAVVVALAAIGIAATVFSFGHLDSGFLWSNFWGGLARVGYAFFAGVLVFRLRSAFLAPAIPVWAAFATLVAIFVVPANDAWRPVWDLAAATIAFPLLIAFAAKSAASGWVARFCSLAGALSYGFYVLQVPVRDWTFVILGHAGIHLPGVATVILVTSLTIVVASALHYGFDVPVRRFLSRHLYKPRDLHAAS